MNKTMNTTKEAFKMANEFHNAYHEKFHSCLKSWKMGAITGVLIAAALSFLFSGFRLDSTFFVLLPFMAVAGIQVMSAVFAMRYTEDFGLSCIPRGIMAVGSAGYNFFEGTYVLLWVYYLIMAGLLCGWLLAVLFFAFVFPLETLYYWIRYKLEAGRVKNMLHSGKITMA